MSILPDRTVLGSEVLKAAVVTVAVGLVLGLSEQLPTNAEM